MTERGRDPLDPIGSECQGDENGERNLRALGLDRESKRGVADVHSANPAQEQIERGQPEPRPDERDGNLDQYGRAGLLFFCAHSSQSVALACNRAPQLAHRL